MPGPIVLSTLPAVYGTRVDLKNLTDGLQALALAGRLIDDREQLFSDRQWQVPSPQVPIQPEFTLFFSKVSSTDCSHSACVRRFTSRSMASFS